MQQVNLYTHEFKPKPVPLSFEQMMLAYALTIAVLVIASLWLGGGTERLADRLENKTDRRDMLLEQVDQLEMAKGAYELDEAAQTANERLKKRKSQRERMLANLAQFDLGEASAYSHILTSLAKQTHQDLWLTSILISGQEASLALNGSSKQPQDVPQWLTQLRSEDAFVGRSFEVFDLSTPTDNRSHHFLLKSMSSDNRPHLSDGDGSEGSSRPHILDRSRAGISREQS